MTKTGSKYWCPIRGNEVVITRKTGGNLVYCGQALAEIAQAFHIHCKFPRIADSLSISIAF